MKAKKTKRTIMSLALDQATNAWLRALARVTGDTPAVIVLSMLHQIRIDDAMAHGEIAPSTETVH